MSRPGLANYFFWRQAKRHGAYLPHGLNCSLQRSPDRWKKSSSGQLANNQTMYFKVLNRMSRVLLTRVSQIEFGTEQGLHNYSISLFQTSSIGNKIPLTHNFMNDFESLFSTWPSWHGASAIFSPVQLIYRPRMDNPIAWASTSIGSTTNTQPLSNSNNSQPEKILDLDLNCGVGRGGEACRK